VVLDMFTVFANLCGYWVDVLTVESESLAILESAKINKTHNCPTGVRNEETKSESFGLDYWME
jgi:hypothetical protein